MYPHPRFCCASGTSGIGSNGSADVNRSQRTSNNCQLAYMAFKLIDLDQLTTKNHARTYWAKSLSRQLCYPPGRTGRGFRHDFQTALYRSRMFGYWWHPSVHQFLGQTVRGYGTLSNIVAPVMKRDGVISGKPSVGFACTRNTTLSTALGG